MTRKRKLLLNTYTALIYQVITIICGFVTPLFIIPYFGSATNGMISSITQFLSVITLCECGVGAVVQSALYKPLADKDNDRISKIFASSKRFFDNILKILAIYIILLITVYPLFLKGSYSFDYFYIGSLILILSFSYIAQYYLFLSYRLLLNADQLAYIQLSVHSIVLILNTVLTVILVKISAPVHIVKLGSAFVFLIQPVVLKSYVDRHYNININIKYDEEPIPQKWNGMAQHIANVILNNTDTVVLTVFSSLENVSIYGVYFLIVHGIRQVIVSFSTGIQSLLGNMLAKREYETLNKTFSNIEIVFHWIVSLLFSITGVLLIPFVKLYTKNFTDANYVLPLFGVLMTLAQASYCLRIPYETMIRAAGHYKETQTSSIIEALINIVSSVILVIVLPENLKLIGVVIGTIMAMCYRTVYLVFYLSQNILKRKVNKFFTNLAVDLLTITIMIVGCYFAPKWNGSYILFFLSAAINGFICLLLSLGVNFLFFRKRFFGAIKLFLR